MTKFNRAAYTYTGAGNTRSGAMCIFHGIAGFAQIRLLASSYFYICVIYSVIISDASRIILYLASQFIALNMAGTINY